MEENWLQRKLLPAVWLCSLLAAQVKGCPHACTTCSGKDNDLCMACKSGWTLYNYTCVDIDECGTKLSSCSPNSFCFNIEGSFECRGCDVACEGCISGGPAHCKKCAPGYRLMGPKCLDINECSDRVRACHGLDEICVNTEGSFCCHCAEGFVRKDGLCSRKQLPNFKEKAFFEDLKDDEVVELQNMFLWVVLCALATLAAKGDFVYTSLFLGAAAAMAGYWLSDRGNSVLDKFLKIPK